MDACKGSCPFVDGGQRSLVGISIANHADFCGVHRRPHRDTFAPLGSVDVVPLAAFGVLRDRSGSVFPSIALHIIYNVGYFMLTGGSSLF